MQTVVDGHEVLRSRLDRDTMTLVEHDATVNITEAAVTGELADVVAEQSRQSLDRLDPERGVLLDAVWLREAGVLLLTAHVLAVDPASWRIVLGELDAGLHALAEGREPTPVREHTSYRRWSRLLVERAERLDSCDYWVAQLAGEDPESGCAADPTADRPRTRRGRHSVGRPIPEVSATLLGGDAADHTSARRRGSADGQSVAVAAATSPGPHRCWRWRHMAGPTPSPPTPTPPTPSGCSAPCTRCGCHRPTRASIGEAIDAIPGDGIDYGLLRYLRADTAERLRAHHEPQLLLNFLGRIDYGVSGEGLQLDRTLLSDVSALPEPEVAVRFELTINAVVLTEGDAPVLATQWRALPDILTETDIAVLQSMWQDALREVAS